VRRVSPVRWADTRRDPSLLATTAGSGKAAVNSIDLSDEIVHPLMPVGRVLLLHAQAHRDHRLTEHEGGRLALS
jgi:hypothetical protein